MLIARRFLTLAGARQTCLLNSRSSWVQRRHVGPGVSLVNSKIPLAPEQRPQQRLLLMPVPTSPVQSDVSFLAMPGDPQQMPRSARYVGQVEWAWARGHDRIDAYWLSTTKARERWILWAAHFDDDQWKFIDHRVAASVARRKQSACDAALSLLVAYWREQHRQVDLDRQGWINEEGLLNAAALKYASLLVWG